MIKKFPTKRTPSTVVGLALDGNRLEGAVVKRTNGSLRVSKTFSATLALNPLNSDPALVGREIRNHLEQAGIRDRACVACIPLSWALSLQVKLPPMPEADEASFLEIEAERGFPYAPETLLMATSICQGVSEEERHATVLAVPLNHLLQLEKVLRAAQLRPLQFTLAVNALHTGQLDSQRGVLAIAVGENTLDLQITCQSGVAVLRSLENAIEVEGAQKSIDADALAREIRVTLGQLPMEMRGLVRQAFIYGTSELAQKLAADLTARLQPMRIAVDWVKAYPGDAFRSQFPPNTPVRPELSASARFLTNARGPFELLPPKISAWQRITTRVSSRKLGWAAAAAGFILLVTGGALGAQQWKLSQLKREWASIETRVREVEEMQGSIRKFRPWFDESFPTLSIWRKVAESFPVEGTIWTKTIDIRNQTQVNCSGTARSTDAFNKALDQLRGSQDVANVKIDSVRGVPPAMQFTFNFQWSPGGRNEN